VRNLLGVVTLRGILQAYGLDQSDNAP